MADTAIAITAGTGTNVDTRTEATNGNHRQVIVIGDPATNAGVAPVDATNGLSVAVTTVGGVAPNSNGQASAANSTPVTLDSTMMIAHDAADSTSQPMKVGARATTSLHGLTLVADADRTNLHAGIDGVLINRPHASLEGIVSGKASNTDGTSTEVLAAGAAGIKHYLTTIILVNMHASSTIYVEMEDGATSKLFLPCPPGGSVFNLPVPIGGSAATAWNFNPSAATTTIYCSVIGFKSKI